MARLTALAVALVMLAAGATVPVAVGAGPSTPGASAAASDAGTTDLVTLTVKVRSNTGDPLGNVRVNVSYANLPGNETTTRANGNTLVDVPRGADLTIHVSDDTYIKNHPVTVEDVGEGEEVTITMYPKAMAQVHVEDETGTVTDATVTLRKKGSDRVAAEGRTSEEGLYQSPRIEAGTYVVTVVKRGYLQTTTEFGVVNVAATTVTLEEATVQVSVRVEDDHFETAEPVPGATVAVINAGETIKQAQTGENGNTQLSIGVNGRYTIRVTKNGYETSEQSFYLAESGKSFTFAINREASLSLSAVNNRVIAGENVLVRVRNAYGEPVEGATISRNGTEVGATDANGELVVTIPERGTFELVAAHEGVTSDGVIVQGVRAATATPTPTPPTPTPSPSPTPTPSPSPTTTTTDSLLPGFGPVLALVGVLLALAALAARARGRS